MNRPSSARSKSGSPRFSTLLIAFVVQLLAWAAFCSLKVGSGAVVTRPVAGYVLLALSVLTIAATLVLTRHERLIVRLIVGTVVVIVYGISGLAEVAYRTTPLTDDSIIWTLGEPFPYIGVVVLPFLVALTTIGGIRRAGDETGALSQSRRAGMILLAKVLLLLVGAAFAIVVPVLAGGGELVFPINVVTATSALTGVFAIFVIVAAEPRGATSAGPLTGVDVAGCVALVSAMHLVILTTVYQFNDAAAGIGDVLLLICAYGGYIATATVLGVNRLRRSQRPVNAPAGPAPA